MATLEYVSVGILFFINLINYMDRFTVAGVLPKVKQFYKLDDEEAGLLQTAFIISYMMIAPLFGYLGDRHSRKYIIIFGILFWSGTTFLGSVISQNHPYIFFLLRALVGVGEASYSTLAPTIIADLFPRAMRTRMLALFYFAIPVGSGLGYIVGSTMASEMQDWRWAMRVTPPLGVISVLLVFFFLREPARGQSDGAVESHGHQHSNLKEDIKYLLTVRSYLLSTVGFTCVCFAIGALSWWAPTYMDYALHVKGDPRCSQTTQDNSQPCLELVSFIFGIITCIGGILGVLIGSGGAQFYRKYNVRADPIVCAFGVLVSVPFVFLGLVFAHSHTGLSWTLIFIGVTLLCFNWALVADMLLYVIVPHRRGMAQALQILFSHLLGDAFSPFIVGALSDSFRNGMQGNIVKYSSLQYGLYATAFVLVFGGVSFLYTSIYIVADQDRCKAQIQGERLSRTSSETSIHTLPPSQPREDFFVQTFPPITSSSDTNYLITS